MAELEELIAILRERAAKFDDAEAQALIEKLSVMLEAREISSDSVHAMLGICRRVYGPAKLN